MAKQDVIDEAKKLGIEVAPEDTIKIIQEKIDALKANTESGVGEVETKAKEPTLPGGLKKIKVNAEQLKKLQEDNKLVGYDPATETALVKS